MKFSLSLILLLLFTVAARSQSRPITAEEYDKVITLAWSTTDAIFPVIRTLTTTYYKDGKVTLAVSEIEESEAYDRRRITWRSLTGGKTMVGSQLTLPMGKVYCSLDGLSWQPSPPASCRRDMFLTRVRVPESVEYSVEQKTLAGKTVKVYRKYSVFPPFTSDRKKDFLEEVSTIDDRGSFLSIVETAGDLDPRIVTRITEQSWDAQTKIKPVVAPR